ncbi:MAG: TetR/AcrR family transcriptional regulator [Anaerolineales bacterium]|nr:TetR/AcrR family transcriptional regulator [Anaerolineales bacterium]
MPKVVNDEDIYQAVIQVVAERGYTGATTKQIAEAANVSEVTLFRKYGSKLQLLELAVNYLIAQSNFPTHIAYTGHLEADLLQVVQAYQASAVENGQFVFMLLAEISRDPELVKLLETPLGVLGAIGELLQRYQAEGRLRPENPMQALAALLGPLIITGMLHKALGEGVIPALDLEVHIARFLEGRSR